MVILAMPAEVPQVADGAVPGADGGLRKVPQRASGKPPVGVREEDDASAAFMCPGELEVAVGGLVAALTPGAVGVDAPVGTATGVGAEEGEPGGVRGRGEGVGGTGEVDGEEDPASGAVGGEVEVDAAVGEA